MKKISLLLAILLMLSSAVLLSSCEDVWDAPVINGTSLADYTIVYDEDSLDYNKRAAEFIQGKALELYKVELEIVDDGAPAGEHEIVVGETSREISSALEADTKELEFAILAKGGSIALEGDYFVIAAAAYFFVETYATGDGIESSVPESVSVHEPIVKEAKNYIMLIGDGMGVYQTKLFDYMENDRDYGDGENIFYGYMLPYIGSSRTDSYSGTTDSAAGGTALACGWKTLNGYVGMNIQQKAVKSLTELSSELGKASAVMSTETQTGATPSTFLAHVQSRSYTDILINKIYETREKYGTVVECGFNQYGVRYMKSIENRVSEVLTKVSADEDGFFLMYEEAHIDKHCHNNDIEGTFDALVRFNQVIARFMEFAFYNPETVILITADHETGDLVPDENGVLTYHNEDHSSADVPIFAYGYGAEVFNGQNVENIQIAHTFAAFMGVDDFGDQSQYQSLTRK